MFSLAEPPELYSVGVGGGGYSAVHLESGEEFGYVGRGGAEGVCYLLVGEAFWVVCGEEVDDFLFAQRLLLEFSVSGHFLPHTFLAEACEVPEVPAFALAHEDELGEEV